MATESNLHSVESLRRRHRGRIGEFYDALCDLQYDNLKQTIKVWIQVLEKQSIDIQLPNQKSPMASTQSLSTAPNIVKTSHNDVINARRAVVNATINSASTQQIKRKIEQGNV